MTFWESEEYLEALPEFFKTDDKPGDKPRARPEKQAVDGVHADVRTLKAMGIPVID